LYRDKREQICHKDYTKGQLNAWANLNIDYKTWEERLAKTKPFFEKFGFKEIKKNRVRKSDIELINFFIQRVKNEI